ncbi:GNAT family N-acetyltransferase [Microbacterium awajiense]|uniref:GNAT family N-acetyltransferase n=1 Tax=Microbacterium awajiense TaxID=415214 RepID=A0ABP7A911_9MICO
MATISPVTADDREEWMPLWRGYLEFYETVIPDAVTDRTFARIVADDSIHGALARDADGRAIGLVHWLFHPATWSIGPYCYLEDLFVAPRARRSGVGEALIAHVRARAVVRGASKVYWLTHHDNATARALYDRVATNSGSRHYEISLD